MPITERAYSFAESTDGLETLGRLYLFLGDEALVPWARNCYPLWAYHCPRSGV